MLLVLLHFLGGSASAWRGVVQALPPGFDVLAVDLPGFGASAQQPGYDVRAMADHVVAAIRARGASRFALVGHSMGAKVAMAVTRRSEDGEPGLAGLSHLVLIAGSPPGVEPMTDDKRATMLSWFQGGESTSRRQAGTFIDDNCDSVLPDGIRSGAIADVLRTKRDAWTAWLSAGSLEDWRARIGTLATPTLVIAGDKDAALGPDAQRRETVPHLLDVAVEVIDEGAHLLPMEHPARVAELIVAHVGSPVPVIPAPYRALIRSPRVSEGTRRVLLARATPPDPAAGALSARALAVLGAVTRRVLPQPGPVPVDLAARIAAQMAEPLGDGWRYAALPADVEAAERGTRTLDAAAGALGFAALEETEQDAMLGSVAAGTLHVPGDGHLTASQMRLWFQDVRSATTRAYVAHPATLARMGYSGIANGGDGPRKIMRTRITADEREPWEPKAEPV